MPGRAHHQAVGEFEPAAIALQHGSEAPTDTAIVELHVFFGAEFGKNSLALRVGEAAEVELVMIAEELSPLGGASETCVSFSAFLSGGCRRKPARRTSAG